MRHADKHRYPGNIRFEYEHKSDRPAEDAIDGSPSRQTDYGTRFHDEYKDALCNGRTSVAPGSVTMRATHRVLVTRDTGDLTDGQVAYGGNLVRDIEHRADLQPQHHPMDSPGRRADRVQARQGRTRPRCRSFVTWTTPPHPYRGGTTPTNRLTVSRS